MRAMVFFSLLLLTPVLHATAQLELLFHMGAGAGGKFVVGVTLENSGDEEIYQGFVVLTPLDGLCYPQPPVLYPFAKVEAGETRQLEIPIAGRLEGYKLTAVHAVDNFGIPVVVVDKLADILAQRQSDYVAQCRQARHQPKDGGS
ncbi:MAG: hypothetical protein ACRDA8_13015 [Shewanella sp.]